MDPLFILATGFNRYWYAVPLIISISLVYSGTRHELLKPILQHAARFAIGVVLFLLFFRLLFMFVESRL